MTTSVSVETKLINPLTTIFTRPRSCSDALYTYYEDLDSKPIYVEDLNGPGNGKSSACYPPDFSAHHSARGVYSPGVCPLGYTAAVTQSTSSVISVHCCPSGMDFGLKTPHVCTSKVSGTTTTVVNGTVTSTISSPFIAANWRVYVEWASSDLSLFTPASAPILARSAISAAARASASSNQASSTVSGSAVSSSSSGSATTVVITRTGTRVGSSAAVSTKPAQHSSSSNTLSAGAQAGIGVGAAVAGLAIIAAAVWFLIRRRRSSRFPKDQSEGSDGLHGVNEDQEYESVPSAENPVELDEGGLRVEMDGDPASREMEASAAPQELEGSSALGELKA